MIARFQHVGLTSTPTASLSISSVQDHLYMIRLCSSFLVFITRTISRQSNEESVMTITVYNWCNRLGWNGNILFHDPLPPLKKNVLLMLCVCSDFPHIEWRSCAFDQTPIASSQFHTIVDLSLLDQFVTLGVSSAVFCGRMLRVH